MTKAKKRFSPLNSSAKLIGLLSAIFATAGFSPAQQNPPLLQITAPTDGSVVNPGQTISVTVSSPANVAFSQVAVLGQDPLGSTDIATSVPAQFTISIPANIICGKYMLTAYGTTSSGQDVESATILIDVERPDLPTSLSALLQRLTFRSPGEQSPIVILGTFSDGSILEVTRSSNSNYTSSNSGVVTVKANGIATAVGPGSASVTATYSQGTQSVQITIPATVLPSVLTALPSSLSFASQNVGTSSASQQLMLTNTSNGALNVSAVNTTGDFSETDNCVSASPLAAGVGCAINVVFNPTGIGPRAGTVRIRNDFYSSPTVISLTGTGTGVVIQPTSVLVVSSPSPAVFGQPVTLTATVSPSSGSTVPAGTVTFLDGSNTIGSATLSGAQAALTISSFPVASHSISAAYSGDSSFAGSTSAILSLIVNSAPTATAINSAPAVTYPSNAVLTLTVSSTAGTPTGNATLSVDGGSALSQPLNASGVATFTLSGLAAGNHTLAASYAAQGNFGSSSTTASVSVLKAPLTVTVANATKVYGAALPSFSVTYSGFVNGDTAASLGGMLIFSTTATQGSPVGSYTITPSGLTSSNYAITFLSSVLSVTTAPLTITANNAMKNFDAPNPTLTWIASGFVNGDNTSAFATSPTCITTATTTSPVGSYPITCSGAAATNYAFSYVPGTLTVVCHYVSLTLSPSTVPQGGLITVRWTLRSCANTAQTVAFKFTLSGPTQPNSCSSTKSDMITTPPFQLQPNTLQTLSFPFPIPKRICTGTYVITVTTMMNGQAVDTSSTSLTVTSH
jgi:hypothetical protein